MTITFENNNDVIVYALEKIISYARRTQQVFVAHCVWWLASVIGLEQGLIVHIDNLQEQGTTSVELPEDKPKERSEEDILRPAVFPVHPSRIQQVPKDREVSLTPRDLTEDQRADQVLDSAERFIEQSTRARITGQRNRVNPLPQTKNQLKKARKIKRLQNARTKEEAERNESHQEIRATVIQYLSKE
jgi:hypothetical protein